MSWLSQFSLGRPGYEYSFDINPEGMSIEDGAIAIRQRNLAGDVKKSVLKVYAPTIKINSSYLAIGQRNQFSTLANISDTFLSFLTRDDWQVILERNISTDTTHVTLPNSSITKLDKIFDAIGANPNITNVNSVTTTADGSGTNYANGGSFDRTNSIVHLGSALAGANTVVYVTYTYKGWLVDMEKLVHAIQGGWVDRFQYDFQLVGA